MRRKLLLLVILILTGCGRMPTSSTSAAITTLPELKATKAAPMPTSTSLSAAAPKPVPLDTAYPYPNLTPAEIPQVTSYPAPLLALLLTPQPTFTATATFNPSEKKQRVRDLWDACRPDWEETVVGFPAKPELAGLLLRTGDALWKIDAQGKYHLISCMPGAKLSEQGDRITFGYENDFWFFDGKTGTVVQITNEPETIPWSGSWSPDGRYFYYIKAHNPAEYDYSPGEIWVYDVSNKTHRQITHSPDWKKGYVQVWPKNPEWIVYIAQTPDYLPGPGLIGSVALAKVDGTEERIVSRIGEFSFSPDGLTLWYYDEGGLRFLTPGQDPKPFPWNQYVFQNWDVNGGGSPAWTQDEKFIAMTAGAKNEIGDYSGIAVMDLTKKKGVFLHPFIPVGSEGPADWFQWSPDGRWLAAYFRDDDFGQFGLWILQADGSVEYHLSKLGDHFWSPEGKRLLYIQETENMLHQTLIFSTTTLQSLPVELPPSTIIVRWDRP